MKFLIKQELPVSKETVRYTELTNGNYIDIIRYNLENCDDDLCSYFDLLIKENIEDKSQYNELCNVDKFLILLKMRKQSMGDILQLKTENGSSVKISIESIVDSIYKKLKDFEFVNIIDTNDYKVTLKPPKAFLLKDMDSLIYSSIHSIETSDDKIIFSDLTDTERDEIISNIPAYISKIILDYIENVQTISKSVNIITENEMLGLNAIPLSFYNKTLFLFIKSILNEDLINYYTLEYNILTKLNINRSDFLQMTPNESKILMGLYNEEMKKQEEASKSSTPRMPTKFR